MVPASLGCGSAVLAAMAILAPSRAARSAMASPMPRLAPEMNSVLPFSVVMMQISVWLLRRWSRGVQNTAAGLRQRERGNEEHAIRRHGEDRDGVAERGRVRERPHQERE